MPKNFNKLPSFLLANLEKIKGSQVQVRSALVFTESELSSGKLEHLGINENNAQLGFKFLVLPSGANGRTSKKNLDGWEVLRKDLPKYPKTFCHEGPIYGDGARNGWTTVCRTTEVYHRDVFPPPLLALETEINQILPNGDFGVICRVRENFDVLADGWQEDLLFAVNLLQENFGVSDIAAKDADAPTYSQQLSWDLFPPGNIDDVVRSIMSGTSRAEFTQELIKTRLEMFDAFQPEQYLRGLGGNDGYIGAKFANDLVAFENLRRGNALYLLYEDWEELSKKPRSELLKMSSKGFDRFVHRDGWEKVFSAMLVEQLNARGKPIRVKSRRYRKR